MDFHDLIVSLNPKGLSLDTSSIIVFISYFMLSQLVLDRLRICI